MPRLRTSIRLLVLLACAYTAGAAWSALAALTPDTLIAALFDGEGYRAELDVNGDQLLTVADVLFLEVPHVPTGTPTVTPTVTITPTPSPTGTATPSPTPTGVLFTGTVAQLVPHAKGDQLVYRVTDPTGKVTTETTTVTSSDPGGAFVIDDQQVDGTKVIKHETQSYTDTGSQLFFVGGTDALHPFPPGSSTTCNPSLLRLTLPVIANLPYSTTSVCTVVLIPSGAFVGNIDRIDAFTPIEVFDMYTVRAGTYANVVHISGSTSLSGDVQTDDIYIAPGVGPILDVTMANGKSNRRELTGGTIGGQPVTH